MPSQSDLRFAIDIGGTFTDTVLMREGSVVATTKTPTTPEPPALGAQGGACHVLAEADAAFADVSAFIHGKTLATNALIKRRGWRLSPMTGSETFSKSRMSGGTANMRST